MLWWAWTQRQVASWRRRASFELAAQLVVDVLDARLAQAQLRLAQRGRQAAVLAGERLGLDEEAEALERDRGERRILLLGEPGGGQGVEPQGLELLEGRFGEHGGGSSLLVS